MRAKRLVFVAHAFVSAALTDLRAAVDSAFEGTEFQPLYADSELVDGHILDRKIHPQIERSVLFLCEISDPSRASIFVEYGLAKGIRKPCVLLLKSGSRPPSDLDGYDRIEYSSHTELTQNLRRQLPWIRSLLAGAGYNEHRVGLICSTTSEIERDAAKTQALARFYQQLFAEFERVPLCINTCGAEPLRRAFLDAYAEKLRCWSREQMRSFEPKVRWYWHRTARHGFGYQPPCFESWECTDRESRTLDEALGSSAIVALAGRSGTREQVERLLVEHKRKGSTLDLRTRPLILLAWFGGTISELITERHEELSWLLRRYDTLEPDREFDDWFHEDRTRMLASKIVTGVHELIRRFTGG